MGKADRARVSAAGKPATELRTSLRDTPFVHLLVSLSDDRRTGTLELSREPGDCDVRVHLRRGVPVCVQCDAPATTLMQILIPLCAWTDGEARFVDGATELDPALPHVSGRVDPVAVVTAAMRGPVREDAVERVLRAAGSGQILVRSRTDLDRYGFTPGERAIAERLKEAPATLQQLREQPDLPWAKVRALIYVLRITHALTLRAPRTYSGTVEQAQPLPRPGSSQSMPAAGGPPPPEHATLSPRKPDASSAYHVRAPSHGEDVVSASSRPPVPEVVWPPDLPQALRLWGEDILQRRARLERSTYFQMLDLERSASGEDVWRAFVALSKRLHPDGLPDELEPARDAAAEVFAYLTEAYETLRDPPRRMDYLREVDAGGGTPATAPAVQRAIDADLHHQKAEILFKRGAYRDALTEAQRALELDDSSARAHALFGYLLHLCRGQQGKVDARVWDHMDRALREDSRCETAHHYRAILLKQQGDLKRAHLHFRRAVKINPNNLDAARELRLAGMREQRQRGLFSRVFKRQG